MHKFFILAVIQADKYRGEIVIGDNGDKDKDIKSEDKIEVKNRCNVEKNSTYKGKMIDQDGKEKCESRVTNIKICSRVRGKNRENVNIELSRDDIYEKILDKNRASNKNMGF